MSNAIPHSYCSVVLCTYNGAAFLPAQLNSLLSQTRLPDFMVVGDDGSTDGTLDILTEFQARAPFRVTILTGEARPLGHAANFARTIGQAEGSWFAFCDQDDVWHPHKLECLEAAFAADPDVLLAFSDASLVAADLSPLGKTMWQRVKIGPTAQRDIAAGNALQLLLKRPRIMGAAAAITARLRCLALPLPPDWPHDAWFATIAAANGRLAALPFPLLDYRQHGNNAVGGLRPSWSKLLHEGLKSDRCNYLAREITRYRHLLTRIKSLQPLVYEPCRLAAATNLVAAKVDYLERRAALPDFPLARWPRVLRAWAGGEYRRWSTDWRSLLLDLFIPNNH